jgi:hypothetical protein
MSYDNSNSGTFGKNKRKEAGDKKPDYTGSVNVAGVPHWLDGWIRTGPDGDKFISLSIKPKEQSNARPPAPARQAQRSDPDDSIPF